MVVAYSGIEHFLSTEVVCGTARLPRFVLTHQLPGFTGQLLPPCLSSPVGCVLLVTNSVRCSREELVRGLGHRRHDLRGGSTALAVLHRLAPHLLDDMIRPHLADTLERQVLKRSV